MATKEYSDRRQRVQDMCERFIGMSVERVEDKLDDLGFSDNSSSPIKENGNIVGRRDVYWSYSDDFDVVIEYGIDRDDSGKIRFGKVYNAYTEQTEDSAVRGSKYSLSEQV